MRCFYISEINPLSVTLFAKIFSHFVGCLCFFMLSFVVQMLLSLISPICLFLFLFSLLWEVDPKRYCCNLCQSVLPMFSFKSFIVSSLMFMSLIHFEFIFVHDIRECSKFILLFYFLFI